MNAIAYIPARSGSKTVRRKNVKELGDKPLLAWSIEVAKKCGLRTVVDSDARGFLTIAEKYGAETLLRPPVLAQDDTPMVDVLKEQLPKLGKVDVVVLLQPTYPFRKVRDILGGIKMLRDADCVVSAHEIVDSSRHPDEMFVMDKAFRVRMASGAPVKNRIRRRQDYNRAFHPTGSFYIFRPENLKNGSIYGNDVQLYLTDEQVNINSREDWEKAELAAKYWKI